MKRVTQTAALLLWALLLAFGAAGTARAQVTTSSLAGRVTNQQGAGVPGVTVLVVNTATGTTSRTVTQSDGRFTVQGLQPGGPYRVTASGLGYTTQTRENLQLALGTTQELNLQLAAQAVALAGITATAERGGAVISSTHTGTAHVISDSSISRLPTLSRDFTDFTRLVPQASTSGAGTNGGGRNNRFNSIQIDGAVNNDLFGLAASGTPGGQAGTKPITLEAIQQFQVVLAPYDVRQGGFTGLGINAVTKSGTNRVNGTLAFFGRNQDLTGRYRFIEADTNAVAPKVAEFKEYQTAFSLGGPIVRNRAFFFVAGEMARRNAPSGKFIGGPGISLNPTKVDSVSAILTNQYGFNPGGVADVNLRRQSNNLFGRLDFNLGRGNRLTLRHNFVDAWDDNFATRTDAFYQFAEAGYRFNSKTNASVGQLNSTLFGRFFNELRAGYTTVRENRQVPVSPFPRIEVLLPGACGGSTCAVEAGPENSSVANALDQDILEITDDVNFSWGAHNLTIGTHNEFFKFSNLFAQNIYGSYRFANIDSLIAGRPIRYDYTFFNESTPGASRRAEFPVRSYALYAQDKVSIGNLSLTGGVRVDMTNLPKNPGDNVLFANRMDSAFRANGLDWGGRRTNQIADHMLTVNPRLGFNWDATGDGSTQLRGGVGLFAGRTPYVWISNAYGNTGLDYTSFACTTAATAPSFVVDPFNQPQGCRTASGGISLPSLAPNNINTVDPDFQMPQVLRTSLALDRELPLGLVGTLEGMFTQSINDVTYRDLTVVGFRQRASGADSVIEGRRVMQRITAPGFGNVYDVTNTSRNYSYSLTAQLQREFRSGWGGSIAYVYGKAYDVNATRSSTARSQFRFNPVPGDPNFIPLAYSDYDVRHRIVADFSRQFMFIRRAPLDLSLIYVGESGRPYSYTYFGDVNGDSQDSNDLIYVPRAQGEVRFASTATISPAQSWANLNAFIERVGCLRENRGRIIPRNACRQPWSNRFDMRVAQTLPTIRNQGLQLTVDITNLANLLNPEWGRSQFVNNQAETLLSRSGTTDTGGHVLLNAFAPKPNVFQTSDLSSRYQVQVGLKYDF